MARRRGAALPASRSSPSQPELSRPKRRAARQDDIPTVYREMLAEARDDLAQSVPDQAERPLKRRRPGEGRAERLAARLAQKRRTASGHGSRGGEDVDEDEDEDNIEFEDVSLPAPVIQTVYDDSEDDSDEEDGLAFEDVDFGALPSSPDQQDAQTQSLELNLTAQRAATIPRRTAERRKPLNRAERQLRLEIHKVHLLCLMAHVARRNRWCNDTVVHNALLPLLSDKMLGFLNPSSRLSQFGQTESLKRGLEQVAKMFRIKFEVTERGMRRALWAEKEEHVKNYQRPDDSDSCFDKAEFRQAAQALQGSRDTGAQLFCALLRCAGVETRLVCSLQPLSCVSGGPPMPRSKAAKTHTKPSKADLYRAAMARYENSNNENSQGAEEGAVPSPRRRLGHPNATAYNVPSLDPRPQPSDPAPHETKHIIRDESPYPVYWVEVLDIAHQKWQPVDPLVTQSQWKPRAFEPPASDRENNLLYAIAFEADGSAKDVTRRYTKAYNSKTRRLRVDGVAMHGTSSTADAAAALVASEGGRLAGSKNSGERWWRRVLRRYGKPWSGGGGGSEDVDQIEDNELAAAEAREPMPRNVADFKDHPVYALARHLRRHEVLLPGAQTVGTVGAGARGPLERIYRRRDVRVARSREKWYRLGREVRPGEEPVKCLPKKADNRRSLLGGDEDDDEDDDDDTTSGRAPADLFGTSRVAGTPIYTFEQTERYIPPPIIDGRVPKNKFGNLDVYVPSMVPAGGAHVVHERAAQAAHVLGLDYAPALTGFSFKGKKGTAVLTGVVVAAEHEDAVRAAAAGLVALDAEMEEEMRAARLLRLWSRFLKGLRIRERIWAGAGDDDDGAGEEGEEEGTGGGVDAKGDIEPATTGGERKGKGKARRRVISDDEDDDEMEDAPSDATETYYMEDDDDQGGGFLVE